MSQYFSCLSLETNIFVDHSLVLCLTSVFKSSFSHQLLNLVIFVSRNDHLQVFHCTLRLLLVRSSRLCFFLWYHIIAQIKYINNMTFAVDFDIYEKQERRGMCYFCSKKMRVTHMCIVCSNVCYKFSDNRRDKQI